jgi:sigma-B regulation protein RsbU (phosphoserine phosphatase)
MSHERAADEFHDALLDDDPVQLYERAPCGYLSTTPDGRIIKVNGTFATWTGYDAKELTSRSFIDLLSVGGRIYHETHYAPLLRMQGTVREIAVDIVRKNGDRLPVLVNARLDRDADGEPRVVRIAVFDATERRSYERELLRAREAAEQSGRRARALARTLQETLIPPLAPAIPGLDVAAAYHPAGDGSEVGGDFYDVFSLASGDWILALGDVCGKGAEAAVVTALARYTVRALAVSHHRPSELLAELDTAVNRHETDRFCTLVLVRLRRDDEGWSATISSGGHPPAVLVRRGQHPEQVVVPGTIIGVLSNATFEERELRLGPGDALLLYTDGVTEARNQDGDFFGTDRLLDCLRRHAARTAVDTAGDTAGDTAVATASGVLAERLVTGLVDEVLSFQQSLPHDDIAVLAVSAPT